MEPTKKLSDPMIGRQLGRCQIKQKLGQGGMGSVYLAHHKGLDIMVAVKVLPQEMALRDDWRKRFVREARVAAKLDHANAVRVLDVSSQEGALFLVMEFVEGDSLGGLLKKRGATPWREAVSQVRQAAEALAVAHELGLVHRDIKPDNLMRAKDGTVKVADFGLARSNAPSDLTVPGQVSGSPAYMAPEQGDGEADGRCDIYSLAITLHTIIAGEAAYKRGSLMETIAANMTEPLPELDGVPPALNQLLAEMTVKDREQRTGSMREVCERLDKLTAGGPPPLVFAAVGAAAVALIAVLALLLSSPGQSGAATASSASNQPSSEPASSSASAPASEPASVSASPSSAASSSEVASSADSSSADSSSGPPPGRPAFGAFKRDVLGELPVGAQLELIDRYLEGLPEGLDRAAALAHRSQLRGRALEASIATTQARLLALVDGGDVAGARAALDAWAEAQADAPADAVARGRSTLEATIARRIGERHAAQLASAERALAAGQLDVAAKALAATEDHGLPALREQAQALATRLAAARKTREESRAREAWHRALAAAHRPLAAGELAEARRALAALHKETAFASYLTATEPEPALRELLAVEAFERGLRAGIEARLGKRERLPLAGKTQQVKLIALVEQGLQVELTRPRVRTVIPLAELPWETRAAWSKAKPLAKAVTLSYAGQARLAAASLAQAQAKASEAERRYLALGRLRTESATASSSAGESAPLEVKIKGRRYKAADVAGRFGLRWEASVGGEIRGMTPIGRELVVGCLDGKVHWLDLSKGRAIATSAPRGRDITHFDAHPVSGPVGSDPHHYILDALDRKKNSWSRILGWDKRGTTHFSFSPDGKQLLLSVFAPHVYNAAREGRRWDRGPRLGEADDGVATACAWKGRAIAIAYQTGHLKTWDRARARLLWSAPLDGRQVSSLAWVDELLVAGGAGGEVRAWLDGKPHRWSRPAVKGQPHAAVALSDDGLLAASDGAAVELRGGPDLRKIATLTGHRGNINQLRWLGGVLLSASVDGVVRAWHLGRR